MKKISKAFKKMPKRITGLIMAIVMLFSYFIPITNVIALTYGEGDNGVKVGIDNELKFTINSVTVNGNPWSNPNDEYRSNDNQYNIVISVSKNGDKIPDIQYGGNWNGYITKNSNNTDDIYTYTLNVNDSGHQGFIGLSIIEKEDNPPVPGPNEESHFDGKAYVVWSCGNGICYHYFEEIPPFNDGKSTFYKATEVTADNDESITFDVHAKYKAWVMPEKFAYWQEVYKNQNNLQNINWNEVDPEDIISEYPPNMGEWEQLAIIDYQNDHTKGCQRPNEDAPREDWEQFESCVDEYYIAAGNLPFIRLQPVGEPQYNNSYVSYGDRNFKVVIYNDNYKGISMGDLNELNYYPSSWSNPFIMRDQFDISGSTKDKPALIDSILLEDTVMIKPLNYNSFNISKIEALDVPENAITITKVNDEFKIKFSSNFYDNVVFKVTDTKNEVSYIKIKRYTIDGWIKFADNHPVLTADFYFDNTKSYSDFDLTAKIIYEDGTTKNVNMTAAFGIDDGLGNTTKDYEVDEQSLGGKGLKKSTFEYLLQDGEDSNIEKVYLNAEYKGSTASNYAGAYVGSGEGVLANIYHGEDD